MTMTMTTTTPPDMHLDLRGLKCPLPVLKARRAASAMAKGALLEILADDPAAELDFMHFCETGNHALEVSEKKDTVLRFVIRV